MISEVNVCEDELNEGESKREEGIKWNDVCKCS
jgi:hypothetical protein